MIPARCASSSARASFLTVACRLPRRTIAPITLDLKNDCVGEGRGQVISLFGFWRVIQDVRTHRVRMAPGGLAELADLRTGAVVAYRFAICSEVVLEVECPGDRREAERGHIAETLQVSERI